MQRKLLVLLTISALLFTGICLSTYLKFYTVNARGRIVGINVQIYQDANLTTLLTEIDWGFIEPGQTKNFSCYAQSLCNVPAYLTLDTDTWQPGNASDYIFLSWNYDNSTLNPGETYQVTFSLFVNPDVSGIDHFSFNIIVTAVKVGKAT